MEIAVSLSALPPSLYRKYVKGWKANPVLLKLFEQLSGKKGRKAMRIYIDAKTDRVMKNIAQDVKAPSVVEEALRAKNIEIVDYIAGTGKDSQGRIVRIGRALKDPDVKRAFDSDPNRKSMTNATRNNQLICISMHPYDIAGMSTDRGWTSCMNIKDGSNKKYVKQDVTSGTLIAYLIDPKDRNINKPVARALAKPYFERQGNLKNQVGDGKVNAMYLVDFAYPDSTMPFVHVLQEWFDEHINPHLATTERNGVYYLKDRLYNDKRSEVHHVNLAELARAGKYQEFGQLAYAERSNPTMDPDVLRTVVVNTVVEYPKAIIPLYKAGYVNVAAFKSIVAGLSAAGSYDQIKEFWQYLHESNATSIMKNKVLEAAYPNVTLMTMLIKTLPRLERAEKVDDMLSRGGFYDANYNDRVNGGFPKALAQIWDFVQMAPKPDNTFWMWASTINPSAVSPSDAFEEYEVGSRRWEEVVLTLSIASLAIREGATPVSLESLRKHKSVLNKTYYHCAEMLLSGAVFVRLDAQDARQQIIDRFVELSGVNPVFAARSLYHIDFDYGEVTRMAMERMSLNVVHDFTPRKDTEALLLNTDSTWQEIREEFIGYCAEDAQSILEELLDEALAKLANGKSTYDPMKPHEEPPEDAEYDDDGIPYMDGDADEEDEDWDDEDFDQLAKEGEDDRPLTPDLLDQRLRDIRGQQTDRDDEPEDDEEFDDSDWDAEFDDNGIPYM
ncbi:putative exonuclease [Erwinia phage pEa_SNUABM_5]|uniref:Putative exonuclease n=1 Tax=Erwinia phage pEa_SNUABM_5 TaxID=2797313 RepID=A0A7T8EPK1_9CAUD|nr:putative exonuclease [Erwinia phage pEa_SNUABM_5]QQO90336.1 putative exonuclease [Erwinia phage pEa_SNUABM_5]